MRLDDGGTGRRNNRHVCAVAGGYPANGLVHSQLCAVLKPEAEYVGIGAVAALKAVFTVNVRKRKRQSPKFGFYVGV